tara:strand:+ start:250 stop:459 length:210 start_codon:yes stop_codon:yes gene_type:complete
MQKEWVIIRWTTAQFMSGNKKGDITIYPDYDDEFLWGSAAYEVLDYFTGTYHEVKRYALKYKREEVNAT